MCRNRARLATAVAAAALAGALSAAASPAFALFGSSKPAPAMTSTTTGAGATATPASSAAQPAQPKPRKATPAERAAAERLDPLARSVFWARETEVDPTDAEAGVGLARALRQLGRTDEAARAAEMVLVVAPTNMDAMLEDSRAKIADGQGFYAIEILKRAETTAPKDWRPVSLMGVALEQAERPDEARTAYQQALALSPDNPAVLSNYALFQAGHGARTEAEALLRRAVARPGADARTRQNLALVLGLEGKMAEAEALMRQDLPPDVAAANLGYLRGETSTTADALSRNWNALQGAQR